MSNLRTSMAAGALFPRAARTNFVALTGQRYRSLCERLKRKKLPAPEFTLEELRQDLLKVMGGREDSPLQCRYCLLWVPLEEVAFDHCTPLSRRGSSGIGNMDYPCARDNDRKGSMTVEEYTDFLQRCRGMSTEARKDVLSRLEKANKLAAAARRVQMLAAEVERLKKELAAALGGHLPSAPKVSNPQDDLDLSGLGAF